MSDQGQAARSQRVELHAASNAPALRVATTDDRGRFVFERVPLGAYTVSYRRSATADPSTHPVTLDPSRPTVDLGRLESGNAPLQMQKFEVGARREAFYNSIDRKVYHVGQDIASTAGTASDLLQNIPSVQVDVEGNVSLRGDEGVEILINGKPSTLMGRNRAAALEQMPADSIARVEVITNPSAKYKPDGTGGIINLVLKREQDAGLTGSLRANAGNDERYNPGLSASYNPGAYTLHGSLSLRQDDRERFGREERTRLDGMGAPMSSTAQQSREASRPLSRLARIGADYRFGRATKLGSTFTYDDRSADGLGYQSTVARDAAGTIVRDSERLRQGRDTEREFELELTFEHAFAAEDRELAAELSYGRSKEIDDDHYTTLSRLGGAPSLDATREGNVETDFNFSADYVHPLPADAKLELGYELEREKSDLDFLASDYDAATQTWSIDPADSNRFIHDSSVHAVYGTLGRPFGRFGILAGLRYEHALVDTAQVTTGVSHDHTYRRVYPSLHLSYQLADAHQLQLSYSHRVNRPDGDDLNPFPTYSDPFNLEAGNPSLVPEDTHSIEAGYHYDHQDTTYLAAVYFRHRYHGVTPVTRYIDANTLLTTPENLATSRAAGLELGATRRMGDALALNFSANVYRNEINAANLGFAGQRAAIAWDAKLNANWKVSSRFRVQLASSYTARRLTAQGAREPWHVTNLGLRYDLKDSRTSLVLTISDVFNTMKHRTTLDTPALRGVTTLRRSSQIVYLGVIYNFGRSGKTKESELEFDETL